MDARGRWGGPVTPPLSQGLSESRNAVGQLQEAEGEKGRAGAMGAGWGARHASMHGRTSFPFLLKD